MRRRRRVGACAAPSTTESKSPRLRRGFAESLFSIPRDESSTLAEMGLRVKPKHKLITLIAVAVLAMAALVYVNLQNVRDTGPRALISQWSLSDVA